MNLRIGIIGPASSVDKIMEVANDFSDMAEFRPYVFLDKNTSIETSKACQDECDILLYSGDIPYQIAMRTGILVKQAIFIPRMGTSFYQVLWEMHKQGIEIKSFSTDVGTINQKMVLETIQELKIDTFQKIFEINYDIYIGYEDLADLHLALWNKGKINAAVTGWIDVFEILKNKNVPAFHLFPTKATIRETINRSILIGKAERNQESQLAVQIIKIRERENASTSNYDFMMIKNSLERILIQYTRENLGSLFPLGRDEYLIFINRGAFENIYNFLDVSSYIQSLDKVRAHIASGIGFGHTVYEAEINARIALSHSLGREFNCAFVIDETGTISGPFAKENNLSFSQKLSSGRTEKIKEIVAKTSLSPITISQLQALMEKSNKDLLDAKMVSSYLNLTVRSARRILNTLLQTGYAELKSTDSKNKTGRPKNLYSVKF